MAGSWVAVRGGPVMVCRSPRRSLFEELPRAAGCLDGERLTSRDCSRHGRILMLRGFFQTAEDRQITPRTTIKHLSQINNMVGRTKSSILIQKDCEIVELLL